MGFLEIFYAYVVIMIPHLFVVRCICVLLSKIHLLFLQPLTLFKKSLNKNLKASDSRSVETTLYYANLLLPSFRHGSLKTILTIIYRHLPLMSQ